MRKQQSRFVRTRVAAWFAFFFMRLITLIEATERAGAWSSGIVVWWSLPNAALRCKVLR